MQFEKQSPGASSTPVLATRPNAATGFPNVSATDFDTFVTVNCRLDIHRVAAGDRYAGESRLRKASSAPGTWWRTLSAAMSWVLLHVIDGIGTYGQAMYPCLVEPPFEDGADRREPMDIARPEAARTSSSSLGAVILSPLARLWSRTRRKQGRRWAIMRLEALDDRTLRDIGIPRGQIDYFVRYGDYGE